MENERLLAVIDKYISEDMVSDFCELFEKITEQLKARKADSIKIVRISFLRSSVLDDLPWFRVDFYNEHDYADRRGIHFYWGCDELIRRINAQKPIPDRLELRSKVAKDEHEFKLLKMTAAERCHELLLKSIMSAISICDKEYYVSQRIAVYYGEYVGPCEKIV